MTRRLLIAVLLLASAAGLAVAIGLRVQRARLADPAQALRAWVRDVPPGIAAIARVVRHDRRTLQIEVRADAGWVRVFVQRNGFEPVEGALDGLAAERWILSEPRIAGGLVHLLRPLDGGPVLISASAP